MSNENNEAIKDNLMSQSTKEIDILFEEFSKPDREKLIEVLADLKYKNFPENADKGYDLGATRHHFKLGVSQLYNMYMFMSEDEESIYFKHRLTRNTISINKMNDKTIEWSKV